MKFRHFELKNEISKLWAKKKSKFWEGKLNYEVLNEKKKLIYNLFDGSKFQIIANPKIKKIREQFQEQNEEYKKFVEIGFNLILNSS